MIESPLSVIGLGQCSLDYLTVVDEYPPADGKCEFTRMAVQSGGPVATALVALSRWGVACRFMGVTGDDSFGEKIRASLKRERVNTAGLIERTGFESQFAFIAAEPGVGRRTVFWRRPTGPALTPEEIDYDVIRSSSALHTDGLFLQASLAACRAAREAGVKVIVDAGSIREGMLDLARESDYFIASELFADKLMGGKKPLEACHKLAELGPRLAGVTLGPRGYIAVTEGRVIERPAYAAEAIDTTGCGDVFHAGFIYGVINEWSLEDSLDFGAWAAARVSLKLGGRDGIPALEDWIDREA